MSGRADRAQDGLLRPRLNWNTVFCVLTALSGLAILIAGGGSTVGRLSSFAATMGLLVAFWSFVRLEQRSGQHRYAVYLALMVAVVAYCSGASSQGTLLLFVGYTQIWVLTIRLRVGVGWSVLLTAAVGAALAWRHSPTGAEWAVLFGQLSIVLVFTVTLGWWTDRAQNQHEQRAQLLASLRAAEDEIAAGHRAAGVLAERARVAQEIHDTLAQGFTSVVMLAQTAQAQITHGMTDAAAGRLEQVEQVARENLAEARALVAAFGPAGLADTGLIAAVQRLAARFATETAVEVQVELAADAEPPDRDTQVVLLRTVQEALANIRKHAEATAATVNLTRSGNQLVLTVADDGRGIDPQAPEGVGLRGMRERIEAIGGRVVLRGTARDGSPGQGTVLQAELPDRDTPPVIPIAPAIPAEAGGQLAQDSPGSPGQDTEGPHHDDGS